MTDSSPVACHDCGRPSWSCAACGTANSCGRSDCNRCDGTMPAELLGDREEGFGMTYKEWIATQIGPRVVGGRYWVGAKGTEYEILAIEPGPRAGWPSWQISVRWLEDNSVTSHWTGWDSCRDTVVSQPNPAQP
ncbi:hypothetical protein [Streptomyces lavendofoliae]|uniref:hypothetical protein n=1 Tax=Streptomyces lavendofoliae TaxID=67314 RepID=UPI003D8F98E9